MEAVFVLVSKLLLIFGISFSERFDTAGIIYATGYFLAVIAIILAAFVLYVALKQYMYNHKVKRSHEYKIEKMLSDIVSDNLKK
ncbi:hypothetical protein MUU46_18235 [Scandinavium sp. TWS1a]|uniref:hypothetical protein n=1 Tax=Scandinavium tedordense TaxID=2926521 RepID=UPI0021668EC1|nr:hypothetical protein [Scandinavium tedordense]MCS2172229.1 hypothetical protein [Scandinavium tedordense]